MAQDWLLLTHDWGFELSEMLQVYQGPLHIFHGDLDWVVPLFFQQCINKLVSNLVTSAVLRKVKIAVLKVLSESTVHDFSVFSMFSGNVSCAAPRSHASPHFEWVGPLLSVSLQ